MDQTEGVTSGKVVSGGMKNDIDRQVAPEAYRENRSQKPQKPRYSPERGSQAAWSRISRILRSLLTDSSTELRPFSTRGGGRPVEIRDSCSVSTWGHEPVRGRGPELAIDSQDVWLIKSRDIS